MRDRTRAVACRAGAGAARCATRGRLLLAAAALCLTAPAQAANFDVDSDAALRAAIVASADGDTITFTGNITLGGDLPAVQSDVTIAGGGFTLSGDDRFRGLFIGAFTGAAQSAVTVVVEDLTIADTRAQGGDGGGAGGGGASLGGALFVADQASLTVRNVSLTGNAAQGGGGSEAGSAGGGGGMGGDGGTDIGIVGGGGLGVGADGGNGVANGQGGIATGADGGGTGGNGTAGGTAGGGGGGSSSFPGGGSGAGGGVGGSDGGAAAIAVGGAGGFGGGGGGGRGAAGGAGGFGGGGGSGLPGGVGGFGGGGGGGGGGNGASGGFGGGSGNDAGNSAGGGGAGMGGAIFVQDGGSLVVAGGLTLNGNSVGGGNGGGNGATGGSAFGAGMFLQGNGTITFAPGLGETQTVADVIADQTGSGGTGSYELVKTGDGTLTLSAANTYTGGTVLDGGTLRLEDDDALGSGDLTVLGSTVDYDDGVTIANAIDLQADATLNVDVGTATQDGAIGESGGSFGIDKTGAGILVLGGDNTFAGGTTISAGTLRVGDGGTTGSIAGDVANDGNLTFNRSDSLTFGGDIGGTGSLTKDGAGVLTLTGDNTFTGATLVSAGTLRLDSDTALGDQTALTVEAGAEVELAGASRAIEVGSIAGGGDIDADNGAFQSFSWGADDTDTTFSGRLFGSSTFKLGAGTTTLSGANDIGILTVLEGTVRIGAGGSLGDTAVFLGLFGTDPATLDLDGNDLSIETLGGIASGRVLLGSGTLTLTDADTNFFGVIEGSGNLVKEGANTLTLRGDNTFTGTTTISGGTLQLGANGTSGSLAGDVVNNGMLVFRRSDTVIYGGDISGTGVLTQNGDGTTVLTGDATHSGGTTITLGTLQIGNGGTTGSIAGDVANDGTLRFDRSDDIAFAGIVSGTGSLEQVGSGTLTLSGANTYSGGTVLDGGTLRIENDDALGTGALTILGSTVDYADGIEMANPIELQENATLNVDAGSATQSGAISESGGSLGIDKTGAGVLVLGGDNSYTGGTTISAGTLRLGDDERLDDDGALTVANGATFDLDGFWESVGTLSGDGAVTLGTDGALFAAGTADSTFSGTITGDGDFAYEGSGTLTLTGTTDIGGVFDLCSCGSGTIDIAGGTVSADLGTLVSGGTLSVGGGGSLTTGDFETHAATIVVDGAGTVATVNGVTFIGFVDSSDLTVSDGGLLETGDAEIDSLVGTSTATVTGTDSLWDVGGTLFVGDATFGGMAVLTVEEGGSVAATDAIEVGAGSTLALGSGGLAGSIATPGIANEGEIVADFTDTLSIGAVVSGTGALSQDGTGTLVLTGANTYSGGTTITAGTLQIGAAGTSGSIAGDVANDGTLRFDRSDDLTFAEIVSGSGVLEQVGSGTLTLSGANTYSGGTVLDGGTLRLEHDDALGSGALTILGSTVDYDDGVTIANPIDLEEDATLNVDVGSATQAGAIGETGGSFGIDKTGGGILVLTGANAYTGGTTITAGTLQIGAAGTSGSIAGDVDNSGALVFNRSDTVTFAGTMSGTGSLAHAGSGTLVLTGASSHTGGTTITAGTLQIGDGGTSGSIAGDVTNAGTLVFDRSDALTYAGVVSGAGALEQNGTGMLTLTGAHTFTGGTTVNAGTLRANGTLGAVTVGAGATLDGIGTVGALTVDGTLAPGNSIGTLSSGPVTFNAGSVLAVEIDDSPASDLLDVTGGATINGGDVQVAAAAGDYVDGLQYTIVRTTTGIVGAFDSVGYATGLGLGMFDLSLLYLGDDVLVQLDRNSQDFAGMVTEPGLRGTADALDELENDPNGDQANMLQHLFGLNSSDALNDAVQQLSGSGVAGGSQNALSGSQSALQAMLGGGGGGPGGGAGFVQGSLAQLALGETSSLDWLASEGITLSMGQDEAPMASSLWIQGIGGYATRDGSGAAVGQERSYYGAVGGLGIPLSNDLTVGPAFSGFDGTTQTDDGLTTVDSTSVMAAGYAVWAPGSWRVNGAAGVARHSFSSERFVSFGGFQGRPAGTHDAWELAADTAVAYDWDAGFLTVSPTAGLTLSWLDDEAWSETGGGGADLSYDSAETWSVQPNAGVGLSREMALDDDLTLTASGQLLWIGQWGDRTTDYTASFTGGTVGWTVPSLEEPENSLGVGLGLDLGSVEGWDLRAAYAGRFGDGAEDHGVLLGFSTAF